MANDNNLIWIDLEMTGLDPDQDAILEIATIVTDANLTILAEGPVFAIAQPDVVLNGMGEWCTKQHAQTGLTERCRSRGVTLEVAEMETLAFLRPYVLSGKSPMCGNSICQDRRFLYRHMKQLERYFHYRHIDVSTIKELALRWAPDIAKGFVKDSQHMALQDIKDSIDELCYYRKRFFI